MSERISPTAYITNHLWHRHGLAPDFLRTDQAALWDAAFRGLTGIAKHLNGTVFDELMLARHRGIDDQLHQAIQNGEVGQVIEVAAGLSARGWRFAQKYPQIQYFDTDLPGMQAEKKRLLAQAPEQLPNLHCRTLDVFAKHGPHSLNELIAGCDTSKGVVIITEGLMNYLDSATAQTVWQGFAKALRTFPQGLYLCDFYTQENNRGVMTQALGSAIKKFVRSRIHIHFPDAPSAIRELQQFGFAQVNILPSEQCPSNLDLADSAAAKRVQILAASS